MIKIESFSGPYRFLSNFYPCFKPEDLGFPANEFTFDASNATTVEHWFQAAKIDSSNPDWKWHLQQVLTSATPGIAKKVGRSVPLRPDWTEIKMEAMRRMLEIKFTKPHFRLQLVETGDALLVEGNTWHDNVWGLCVCPDCVLKCRCADCNSGEGNQLGKMLMTLRSELSITNG